MEEKTLATTEKSLKQSCEPTNLNLHGFVNDIGLRHKVQLKTDVFGVDY